MKRLTLLLAIIAAAAFGAAAQWGRANNVRLEHNVPDNGNGRQMLQVHFNMEVHGANGHNIIPAVFVDSPKGVGHKWRNGENMKQDGSVYTSNYEDCYWNGDLWIGIYNDALNPKPGKNTYYVRIGIWDCNLGRWINDWNNTPWVSYDMTGSQQAAPAPSYQAPIYTPAPAYPQQSQCGVCGGTGRCSNCGGSGISPHHARGIVANCGACGGTGRCATCSGRGWH